MFLPMDFDPFQRAATPRPLPRFVMLTQTNGRKTYVRLDLIDEHHIKEDGFHGSRLTLKTQNHPTIAFNGALCVFESPEKIEDLMGTAVATYRTLKFLGFMSGIEKNIQADEIDIIQTIDYADRPLTNIYTNNVSLVQAAKNPLENPENIMQPAEILPFVRPSRIRDLSF